MFNAAKWFCVGGASTQFLLAVFATGAQVDVHLQILAIYMVGIVIAFKE